MSLEQTFEAAQLLPSEERKMLLHVLQESFDAPPPDFDEEFAVELERRIAEMESSASVGIPYEDVMREARARFK